MKTKLAQKWNLSIVDAQDIINCMEARKWSGSNLAIIAFAGVINDKANSNKIHGNNGYWIADNEGHVCAIANGDPIWCDWSEDIAIDCGLQWGDFADAVKGHEVA